MIIPGFPTPFIGGLVGYDVTFGNTNITVGDNTATGSGYGYLSGRNGSLSMNTLISIDGAVLSENSINILSVGDLNFALFGLSSGDEATAVYDAIVANYSELRASDNSWVFQTSLFYVNGQSVTTTGFTSSNYWGSSDVGNTKTMEWVV